MKAKKKIWLLLLCFVFNFGLLGYVKASWAGPFRIGASGNYRVYFATTRYNESRSSSRPDYQGRRHLDTGEGSLDYGYANVRRPALLQNLEHARNFPEFKARLNINDKAWSTTPVSGISVTQKSNFDSLVSSWQGTICIFVHGYDESFQDSLRDTAIIGSELEYKLESQNTKVLPILFSWPSLDKTAEYAADEANMHWSKLPYRNFVESVARIKRPSTKLLLVAHSLGSRMAFDLINSNELKNSQSIEKIVLSSSDFDYHQALQKKESLEKLVQDKVFVLVSERDGPLLTSQLLHGSPRLGRPFDPPNVSKVARTSTPQYSDKSFWKGLLKEAVDIIAPKTDSNSPEISQWLLNGKTAERELGSKSRFYDVTELVTGDLGHRLAWPVITSLLAQGENLSPLREKTVQKMPDKLFLEQYGGTPPYLFRFHRVTGESFGGPFN